MKSVHNELRIRIQFEPEWQVYKQTIYLVGNRVSVKVEDRVCDQVSNQFQIKVWNQVWNDIK